MIQVSQPLLCYCCILGLLVIKDSYFERKKKWEKNNSWIGWLVLLHHKKGFASQRVLCGICIFGVLGKAPVTPCDLVRKQMNE